MKSIFTFINILKFLQRFQQLIIASLSASTNMILLFIEWILHFITIYETAIKLLIKNKIKIF